MFTMANPKMDPKGNSPLATSAPGFCQGTRVAERRGSQALRGLRYRDQLSTSAESLIPHAV